MALNGTCREMEKGSQVGVTCQCSSISIRLIPHTSQRKGSTELIMSVNQLSGKRENLWNLLARKQEVKISVRLNF